MGPTNNFELNPNLKLDLVDFVQNSGIYIDLKQNHLQLPKDAFFALCIGSVCLHQFIL